MLYVVRLDHRHTSTKEQRPPQESAKIASNEQDKDVYVFEEKFQEVSPPKEHETTGPRTNPVQLKQLPCRQRERKNSKPPPEDALSSSKKRRRIGSGPTLADRKSVV